MDKKLIKELTIPALVLFFCILVLSFQISMIVSKENAKKAIATFRELSADTTSVEVK